MQLIFSFAHSPCPLSFRVFPCFLPHTLCFILFPLHIPMFLLLLCPFNYGWDSLFLRIVFISSELCFYVVLLEGALIVEFPLSCICTVDTIAQARKRTWVFPRVSNVDIAYIPHMFCLQTSNLSASLSTRKMRTVGPRSPVPFKI